MAIIDGTTMTAVYAAHPTVRSIRGRQDLAFRERARQAVGAEFPVLTLSGGAWAELGRLAMARGDEAACQAARTLTTGHYRTARACAYLRDLRRDPTRPASSADVETLMVALRRAIINYQNRHGQVSEALAEMVCAQIVQEVRDARSARS